jgi:hypothetical protein
MQRASQPKPLLDDLPVLGSGPHGVPIALGATFLATDAKVNESEATRLRQGGPLECYREPSERLNTVLMSQPFTPVIVPAPRDPSPRTQRGVQ